MSLDNLRKTLATAEFSHIKKSYFLQYVKNYLISKQKKFCIENIENIPLNTIPHFNNLPQLSNQRQQQLSKKIAICKLNGGLGTSLGSTIPKAFLTVKDNKTILEIIINKKEYQNKQYESSIPLILMNSFYSDELTLKKLSQSENKNIYTFQQNYYPRIDKKTFIPLSVTTYGQQAYYPPGHGDFYCSIKENGILETLLKQGIEYIFVSNIDNLGADIDFRILNYLIEKKCDMLVEVTHKNSNDIKGGTIVRENNQLKLLEKADIPEEYSSIFSDTSKYPLFNTNNIWLNIESLKNAPLNLSSQLPIIENNKKIADKKIIQLETAIASAINFFNSELLLVDRTRFLPIKTTNDLFLLCSNLFQLENHSLKFHLDAHQNFPVIKLGKDFFIANDFYKKVPYTTNISQLESLELEGPITVGKNVSFGGNIKIFTEEPIFIPDNTTIIGGK